MPSARHAFIAREGWTALTVTVAAAFLLYAVLGVAGAAPAVMLFAVLVLFFRDPPRDPPSLPLALVCPLDGRVTAAGADHDPWLGRESVRVGLATGLFDVHSLFSPIEGKLVEQWTHPKYPDENMVRMGNTLAYQIRTDEGDDVVLEIAQGPWRGAVRFPYQPGERVGHGRRVGYAPLGCRINVYAPVTSQVQVSTGEHTTAACTILAVMVHEHAVSSLELRNPE